jgi:hypothetical protein
VRHRRLRLPTAALLVTAACAAPASSAPLTLPSQRSEGDALVSEREPLVRFEADRDVLLLGEIPIIHLEWLGSGLDRASSSPARSAGSAAPMTLAVQGPGGPLRRHCAARQQLEPVTRSSTSAEYYLVGRDCYQFTRPGRYRLTATPRALPEQLQRVPNARLAATLFIRVIERPPATAPSSEGLAFSLQVFDDQFASCARQADDFRVVRHRDEVFVEAAGRQPGITFPSALQRVLPLLKIGTGLRKRPPVASALQPTGRGWLLGTSTGDPGGGLVAVESSGKRPLAFETGYGLVSSRRYCARVTDCRLPQDVTAIEKEPGAADSYLVFQGRDESGRISRLSWHGGHWSARVIADLHRAPGAWIKRPSPSWLVVTGAGLLEVVPDGSKTVLSHLPIVTLSPNSLVELPSGTIWIGLRGGAIRLTPTWQEAPRYWPELIVRSSSRLARVATSGERCPPFP